MCKVLAYSRLAKATDANALEAQAFGVKQRGTSMLPAILRHGQEDLPVPELEDGVQRSFSGSATWGSTQKLAMQARISHATYLTVSDST